MYKKRNVISEKTSLINREQEVHVMSKQNSGLFTRWLGFVDLVIPCKMHYSYLSSLESLLYYKALKLLYTIVGTLSIAKKTSMSKK